MFSGGTATAIFYVRSLAQTVLTPDSLPIGTLIRNGIDTTVAVTITTLSDGAYLAQSTLPSSWAEGDVVHLRIVATYQGLTRKQTLKLGEVAIPLASAVATVQDLSDLRGFTPGHPMTADSSTNTIAANGKEVVLTENGTVTTYTRTT